MRIFWAIFYAIFLYTFCLILCPSAHSADREMLYGPYEAEYIATIDGDTVAMALHIYPGLTSTVRIRERTVDTPELRKSPACEKKLAQEALQFTKGLMESAKKITVTDVGYGTFQPRMVGTIYVNDEPLGSLLKAAGYAVDYRDREGMDWCGS